MGLRFACIAGMCATRGDAVNFNQIKRLKKRCDHFVGHGYTPDFALGCAMPATEYIWPNIVKYPNDIAHARLLGLHSKYLDRNDWKRMEYDGPATGMGIAARNYSAMMPLLGFDNYLEHLLWVDAVAASFNRYIDENLIANDEVAKRCLRWWRDHLFFSPEHLN